MHIAFSALRQLTGVNNNQDSRDTLNEHEALQRFEGYKTACEKYRDEIAAIQKYMPGWMPAFKRS
ncbi:MULTISPECIES: hypothetical protein [Mucilaginibacter]|uniref:hypothetical protein n=1 Tax=Mucilaginibacter TaxID=423349 RepID=UPI00159EB771|nr:MULTISPECIES: hypothetical protein [Mucilaginibacter]NVM62561.1 hypothetical protein [Mucilaginibacter sp. SG538B]GGB08098.1 hypothetical protein GCM10011500_24750 [Mucilaginibacter rubeus]